LRIFLRQGRICSSELKSEKIIASKLNEENMLKFRPMNSLEFKNHIQNDLEDYIRDISLYENEFIKQTGKSPKEFAETQFKEMLPKGVESSNNFFWIVLNSDTNEEIGYIWFTLKPQMKYCLLTQIKVYELYRRKGFGTEILHYWENHVKQTYPEIKGLYLHVFKHNPNAKRLYEENGFKILNESFEGWTMSKPFEKK